MVIRRYEIYLVSLDPTLGHEIRKSRPCVILSPDEMNAHIATVLISPMTTKSHPYPSRVPVTFQNTPGAISQVKAVIQEMLVE